MKLRAGLPDLFFCVAGLAVAGVVMLPLTKSQGTISSSTGPATGVVGTPPARSNAAMAYDPDTRQVVLFGGGGTNGPLGDTWVWTGTNWIKPDLPLSPHSRDGASMVFDPKLHALVLVGGSTDGYPGPSEKADLAATWLWTGAVWERLPTGDIPASGSGPIVYDAASGRVVMVTVEACSTQTWTFDGGAWQLGDPAIAIPFATVEALVDEPQTGHVIAVLAPIPDTSARIWGIGSSCPAGSPVALPQSSTWRWTGSTWVEVSQGTEPGGSLFAQASNGTSVRLDAVTGRSMVLTDNNEVLWQWNGEKWSVVPGATTGPKARSDSMQTVDATGDIVLYGGIFEPNGPVAYDTWVWDGARWSESIGPVPATSTPSPAQFTPAGP